MNRKKILIVDDDRQVSLALSVRLKAADYDVDVAGDGAVPPAGPEPLAGVAAGQEQFTAAVGEHHQVGAVALAATGVARPLRRGADHAVVVIHPDEHISHNRESTGSVDSTRLNRRVFRRLLDPPPPLLIDLKGTKSVPFLN